MNTLGEIASVLKKCKSATIFTHTRPDGDAIGSALALSHALNRLGIESEIVNDCEIPQTFLMLEGAKEIKRTPTRNAEVYICVDLSDESRLGELQKTFLKGYNQRKLTVNIDHHISNTRFCDYNFVQAKSSNCEHIATLIKELGVKQDKQIADCLLAGMITDSGAFSHSDVDGDTFRAAAECADAGADVNAINYHIFKKQSLSRAKMYARVISSLRFLLDNQLCVSYVSQEMLKEFNLKSDATTGIVDFGLTIDTVEVSVCLMEVKEGQYKASFRSKGRADVNRVAGIFGGGGHVLASGCMLFGDLEDAIDRMRYAVSQYLD